MSFLVRAYQSLTVVKVNLNRRFELIHKLGQGSMSQVWRARDTLTGRIVAVKVLDKAKLRRLESRFVGLTKPTEGQVAIRLQHPHIVRTLEHGISTRNEQYLVMEYIDGVSLSLLIDLQNDLMKTHRLTFMIQLGEAISYFHRQNWIHRDLCPRNVLIDSDDQIKLFDFGLVVPNTPSFQAPGNRTGTVAYMAPELIRRQPTNQRIDLYSYSVSCYEMFTKRLPFVADLGLSLDVVIQNMNQRPLDIRELVPEIDEQIAATIMKGLARNPEDRWISVEEMVEQFRETRLRLEPEFADEYDDEYDDEYEDEGEYEDEEYEEIEGEKG